jgi:hypothetical protein
MLKDGKKAVDWSSAIWWSKLVVAVIAVPMIGVLVSAMAPGGEFGQVIAFVATCWVSVFFGMKLMDTAKTSK